MTAHRTPFHKQFNLPGKEPFKEMYFKTFLRPLKLEKIFGTFPQLGLNVSIPNNLI
jgi:hypothetical protein